MIDQKKRENLIADARNHLSESLIVDADGDPHESHKHRFLGALKANIVGKEDRVLESKYSAAIAANTLGLLDDGKNPFNAKREALLFRQFELGRHGGKNNELDLLQTPNEYINKDKFVTLAESYNDAANVHLGRGNPVESKTKSREANTLAMALGNRLDGKNPFSQEKYPALNRYFDQGRLERETWTEQVTSFKLLDSAYKTLKPKEAIRVYPVLDIAYKVSEKAKNQQPNIPDKDLKDMTRLAIANISASGFVSEQAKHNQMQKTGTMER